MEYVLLYIPVGMRLRTRQLLQSKDLRVVGFSMNEGYLVLYPTFYYSVPSAKGESVVCVSDALLEILQLLPKEALITYLSEYKHERVL